jgi:DNA primase
MSYLNELKSKADILLLAYKLGFKGKRSGRCFQGDCLMHLSSGGKCLTIWPSIQGWKCFHCHASGDVIDLVQHYKNKFGFIDAVNFIADYIGMPRMGNSNLSPEKISEIQIEESEKNLVYDMLAAAAEWYHERLQDFPQIKDHLLTHYKFSEAIIDEILIGFAPPISNRLDQTSDLAIHLSNVSRFKGRLTLTGLFNFKDPQGPYYDYFKGRIVFPYWKHGKVVDMIARATTLTPIDQYECYNFKEEKVE